MRKTLVQRIAPYLVTPEERWSARPITEWLRAWQANTGDDAATIARGFALENDTVTDLLDGAIRTLTATEASLICRALRVDPADFWPHRITRAAEAT